MKKSLILIMFLFVLALLTTTVQAASFGISASTSQVNPNGTFTVSVGGDCIGRVNLSVSNGSLSTSSVWVEQGYQTVTVTAGSSGSVTVTATPVAGFSDSSANEYTPGSRSTTVSIVDSTTSTPSTTPNSSQKPTTKKSSNNLLSSLTINSGTLEPNFDGNVSEYKVQLSKDVTSVIIDAKVADGKAKIEGTGEINVKPGDNTINIVVTAENGAKKTYTINAYVDETPQVYIKYKEKEIGVLRNLKNINIPEGFTESDHSINEYTIKVFSNDKFSIIYGINDENEKSFYLFDSEKNECTNKIIPMIINAKTMYLIDTEIEKEGFEKSSIVLNEQEIICYKFKEGFENYFLVTVMDNSGEMIDYIYENTEGTWQLYAGFAPVNYDKYKDLSQITNEQYKSMTEDLQKRQVIIYIIIALWIISIIILVVIIILKSRKEKSNEEVH